MPRLMTSLVSVWNMSRENETSENVNTMNEFDEEQRCLIKGQTDGRTDERTDRQMDRQIDRQTVSSSHLCDNCRLCCSSFLCPFSSSPRGDREEAERVQKRLQDLEHAHFLPGTVRDRMENILTYWLN